MTSNELKLSEDWGWFVDMHYSRIFPIALCKKGNTLLTILKYMYIFYDEYEYYKNTSTPPKNRFVGHYKNENKFINKKDNMVYDLASTTFITTILGYLAYFVL